MYSQILKYDLSKLKPIIENEKYEIYKLGHISENVAKGVRVDKNTCEQVDVHIELYPKIRVIAVIRDNIIQKIK